MVIFLDAFFPTTKEKLKKLLVKVIRLDWENQRELRETLKIYFQEKKAEHESYLESNGKIAVLTLKEHQRMAKQFEGHIEMLQSEIAYHSW